MSYGLPKADGLYDPQNEHDACGVGFCANIKGEKSHDIIQKGIEILINLTHRGAVGSDPETGDGAGLLFQMPDKFFREVADEMHFTLPELGKYGVGFLFMPTDPGIREECKDKIEKATLDNNCRILAWREVPVVRDAVGVTAQKVCPDFYQVFIQAPEDGISLEDYERSLYKIRRKAENDIKALGGQAAEMFHAASFSAITVCYKGMMLAAQVSKFYPDLNNPKMDSALCVVHQRYSTNTFPTWDLAQPFRMMCHNGEINTLKGNVNNMKARYSVLKSDYYGDGLKDILPVIHNENGSDSACFDNMLEFLFMNGRSLTHSMMMMVPEAWGTKCHMGHDRRAFFAYHSMMMEPWDGPAALVGTDGSRICVTLDRNGLRPVRYEITEDGFIVGASEIGVLELDESKVIEKGRLAPGTILLIDTERKRVLHDEEVKAEICRQKPYRRWVAANRIELRGLFDGNAAVEADEDILFERQTAHGYTREDIDNIITPMFISGAEPIGSMGDDTPLAVLSDKPQLMFNYFKQLFAQVTNPAIDPIREKLVMSLTTYLGPCRNLLEETPEHARMLKLNSPIITNDDLDRIRNLGASEFPSITLDIIFPVDEGEKGLEKALDALCNDAEEAIRNGGKTVIILSDRKMCADYAAIPSLLAVSAVNSHLVSAGLRMSGNIILESGEPREIEHFALLFGYGVSAVNPYLALETIAKRISEGNLQKPMYVQDGIENYITAIEKGLLKIFSKMGISTLRSYRDAQIFEILGLSSKLVGKYFNNTPSRIGGLGAEEIAHETLLRHKKAYPTRSGGSKVLESGGRYSLRRDGERHLWTPDAIRFLQEATRENNTEKYDSFKEQINNQLQKHCTLRSLFDFNSELTPISIDEVEPVENIMKRFVTGAMSFGSISREAHESMAIAMNRIGGRSNSGEGGEDSKRYIPLDNGDSRCSMTKQVASGRFGVTAEYLNNCKEIQIKISQGAKPGEGGHLPGHKVNVEIAGVRHSTPGISLISPPPHHDIYSIEDLAQLIFDLKNINPNADINVKLVSEVGVGTIAAGVAKGHADAILISGADGGTGAAPMSSIKYAGIPWELGLSETQQVLVKNDLRGRVKLQTDGQMRTGRDVVISALLGAEEYGFATASLIVLGCVMMRKCQKNTCPVGVATQDPRLRKRFHGSPDYLVNFFRFIATEVREIMASLGYKTMEEMIGQAHRLKIRDGIDHWKASTLDFSKVFHIPAEAKDNAIRKIQNQDHGLEGILDRKLIETCKEAIENGTKVTADFAIKNINRTTTTMLAGEIAKRYGHKGLPEDTITLNFTGSAGQSFGAFATYGMTLNLVGDVNDYLGKGLSGGKLVIKTPEECKLEAQENTIVGNVCFYGATCGKAFINGLAGERFGIRNSGVEVVVEGVGNHGCEYMTGGRVVCLGSTGINFAAGMSGGIAYIYDPQQDFDLKCNLEMVDLDPLIDCSDDDIAYVRSMIEQHKAYTGSKKAAWMLDNWEHVLQLFVRVMPMEYRRLLGQMVKEEKKGSRRTKDEVITNA